MPADLIAALTTVATREEAHALAASLVEDRLAACVHIQEIESVYRWDGAVRREPEFRLLLKTTAARYPALEAAVRDRHPYDVPMLVALPVTAALDAYAEWVEAEGRVL